MINSRLRTNINRVSSPATVARTSAGTTEAPKDLSIEGRLESIVMDLFKRDDTQIQFFQDLKLCNEIQGDWKNIRESLMRLIDSILQTGFSLLIGVPTILISLKNIFFKVLRNWRVVDFFESDDMHKNIAEYEARERELARTEENERIFSNVDVYNKHSMAKAWNEKTQKKFNINLEDCQDLDNKIIYTKPMLNLIRKTALQFPLNRKLPENELENLVNEELIDVYRKRCRNDFLTANGYDKVKEEYNKTKRAIAEIKSAPDYNPNDPKTISDLHQLDSENLQAYDYAMRVAKPVIENYYDAHWNMRYLKTYQEKGEEIDWKGENVEDGIREAQLAINKLKPRIDRIFQTKTGDGMYKMSLALGIDQLIETEELMTGTWRLDNENMPNI